MYLPLHRDASDASLVALFLWTVDFTFRQNFFNATIFLNSDAFHLDEKWLSDPTITTQSKC